MDTNTPAREVHGHELNAANQTILIHADEPSHGNASHEYSVNYLPKQPDGMYTTEAQFLKFQNGPINEVGVNGLTHEVLLTIVADRLKGFQSGPYACRENALALTKIEEALHWLHHRTRQREQRNVEGTHQV